MLFLPHEQDRTTENITELIEVLKVMSQASMKEQGCEAYRLLHSGPGEELDLSIYQGPYFTHEVYSSEESEKAHLGTDHMQSYRNWKNMNSTFANANNGWFGKGWVQIPPGCGQMAPVDREPLECIQDPVACAKMRGRPDDTEQVEGVQQLYEFYNGDAPLGRVTDVSIDASLLNAFKKPDQASIDGLFKRYNKDGTPKA